MMKRPAKIMMGNIVVKEKLQQQDSESRGGRRGLKQLLICEIDITLCIVCELDRELLKWL